MKTCPCCGVNLAEFGNSDEMSFAEFNAMAHLLPATANELVRIIGGRAAWQMIVKYGGTRFLLTRPNHHIGSNPMQTLINAVGRENAERLQYAFLNQRSFTVPRCRDIWVELKRRKIRARFDEIHKTAPYNEVVNRLCREFNVTQRAVSQALSVGDKVPNAYQVKPSQIKPQASAAECYDLFE